MLAFWKYEKWKEQVKVSEYRKIGGVSLKTVALFLKTNFN
jgi:hypothetical protein